MNYLPVLALALGLLLVCSKIKASFFLVAISLTSRLLFFLLLCVPRAERTDVWAWGITAWEIFSNGKLPFKHLSSREAKEQIRNQGLRLSQPEACPPEIWGVLQACWANDQDSRPSFSDLLDHFEDAVAVLGPLPQPRDIGAVLNHELMRKDRGEAELARRASQMLRQA
eukprot:m.276805 g.276805  ORF g.276805 m.276805 type:complete len:169 (-) comp19366_c0_seq36:139-645(-)